jgi:hypothetical protein
MVIKLKDSGGLWKSVSSVYIKTSAGAWKSVGKAFIKTAEGWKIFHGASSFGPQIDSPPTISAGAWSVISDIGRFELTGTNGIWSYSGGGTITQTYAFQSSQDGNNWSDIDTGSISNSQTKTFTVYQSDFSSATQYYRFSVSATANVDNTVNTENSTSQSVTIPSPTPLTGGYVLALASGTGQLNPSVASTNQSGGENQFTLSWGAFTNVSSASVSWDLSGTDPASPQTATSDSSITVTKTVTSSTNVYGSLQLYGYAGTGGSFSAGWDTSAYANQYNISYSINGGIVQSTTSTGNSISLGSGVPGDSISITITPYNTNSMLSGTSYIGSGTIPANTVPSISYGFGVVQVVPTGTLTPVANGSTPIITNSGGTLTMSAGSWTNSPTQYRYVWQRIEPLSPGTITHTTTFTTDSYTPGSTTPGHIWSCTVNAYNSYGWSTSFYAASYEFIATTTTTTAAPTTYYYATSTCDFQNGTYTVSPTCSSTTTLPSGYVANTLKTTTGVRTTKQEYYGTTNCTTSLAQVAQSACTTTTTTTAATTTTTAATTTTAPPVVRDNACTAANRVNGLCTGTCGGTGAIRDC